MKRKVSEGAESNTAIIIAVLLCAPSPLRQKGSYHSILDGQYGSESLV